jgi:hypothetical protein
MRWAHAAASLVIALPLAAADPAGKAEGMLTVNGVKTPLVYAYVIDRQTNELTHTKSDTKIILTDKPLPDGTDLSKVDYWFPDGLLGVVVCIDKEQLVSHVVVQHSGGTIDAGYFTNVPQYAFKRKRSDRGVMSGTVSTPHPVASLSATYEYEVHFEAPVQ